MGRERNPGRNDYLAASGVLRLLFATTDDPQAQDQIASVMARLQQQAEQLPPQPSSLFDRLRRKKRTFQLATQEEKAIATAKTAEAERHMALTQATKKQSEEAQQRENEERARASEQQKKEKMKQDELAKTLTSEKKNIVKSRTGWTLSPVTDTKQLSALGKPLEKLIADGTYPGNYINIDPDGNPIKAMKNTSTYISIRTQQSIVHNEQRFVLDIWNLGKTYESDYGSISATMEITQSWFVEGNIEGGVLTSFVRLKNNTEETPREYIYKLSIPTVNVADPRVEVTRMVPTR